MSPTTGKEGFVKFKTKNRPNFRDLYFKSILFRGNSKFIEIFSTQLYKESAML